MMRRQFVQTPTEQWQEQRGLIDRTQLLRTQYDHQRLGGVTATRPPGLQAWY